MKKRLITLGKWTAWVAMILMATLALFEFCYRTYVIDFYRFSWVALNSESSRDKSPVDLLVFGDSFSAKMQGYVDKLAQAFPEKVILNASYSGIGIKQVNLFASERIKAVNPRAILYQVYVGNDLLDVQNLSNWQKLPLSRNIYWNCSDYLLSMRYLNQRLVGLRRDRTLESLGLDKAFSVQQYDKRSHLYIQADAAYLYKTVTLQDDFLQRYASWKREMEVLIAKIPADIKLYIVFIPHCAQLNDFYFNNMSSLGNTFANKEYFQQEQYAFMKKASIDFRNHSNIIFLNPLAHLRKADREGNRLYYENDPHFSIRGDEELAHYLVGEIFNKNGASNFTD